jgi:hypothetical protein
VTEKIAAAIDQDAEQLRSLGYTSHFDRTMSKWENFSLGFTYLSPVVGVYTIFASAFIAGGPPMWWTYLLVGLGQFTVCLDFWRNRFSIPDLRRPLSVGTPPDG